LAQAHQNANILLVTGDLGYGVLNDIESELPNQYINTGITEQSSISFVAGLARAGFLPFFYSIGNFPTLRALEQIRNDVCHMALPATIVAVGAGFSYGTAGYSHHLIEDISALSSFDLDIYTPSMPSEIKNCIESILKRGRPAYLRLGKGGERSFTAENRVFQFPDELDVIPSSEITILVNSAIIEEVVSAVEEAEIDGESVTILSCWTMKQLNETEKRFLDSRRKILVIEEHVLRGGFGSFIDEQLPFTSKKVIRIGIQSVNRNFCGSTRYLREIYGLDKLTLVRVLENLNQ
jgi:transketolase